MKKSGILEDIHKRLKELEEKPEEDETVCPECGSDLYEVEEGVLWCDKCKQAYETED